MDRSFRKPGIESFTRQLSFLIQAGVSIIEALSILESQIEHPVFRETIRQIRERIMGGSSISEAFGKDTHFFSPVYISMLQAGEATGNLSGALIRIAELLEREKRIQSKVSDGLRYPALVLSSLVLASTIVVFFVIPRFGAFFSRANVPLPLPTRMLIAISQILSRFGWTIFLIPLVAFILWQRAMSDPKNRIRRDQAILHLPGLGGFLHSIESSRFTRNLSVLLNEGVHLPYALKISQRVTKNIFLQQSIRELETDVLEGKPLATSKGLSHLVPDAISAMITVGERSGRLPEVLRQGADFLETEVDRKLQEFIQRLEPTMIIIMGAGIAFLAFAVFLPMWNILSVIQH